MPDKEKLLKCLYYELDETKEEFKHRDSFHNFCRVEAASNLINKIESGEFDIKQEAKEACRWVLPPDSSDSMDYETECGHKVDEEYILIKNPYKYCPYCSKPIQEVQDE